YSFLERIAVERRGFSWPTPAAGRQPGPEYGRTALASEAAQVARKPTRRRHRHPPGCTLPLASPVKGQGPGENEVLRELPLAARSNGMEAEGRAGEINEVWASAMAMASPRKIESQARKSRESRTTYPDHDDTPITLPEWPALLDLAAYHGLAG